MEEKHERTFHEMRMSLSIEEAEARVYDPNDEAKLYLRAFASGNVFDATKDPTEMFTADLAIEDVIERAIELEKESVLFYLGIRSAVTDKNIQDKVNDIVNEELSHITILLKALPR